MDSLRALQQRSSVITAQSHKVLEIVDGGGGFLPPLGGAGTPKEPVSRVGVSRSAPTLRLHRSRSEAPQPSQKSSDLETEGLPKLPPLTSKFSGSFAPPQLPLDELLLEVDGRKDIRAEADEKHQQAIFDLNKQYSMGLRNFDDELVAAMLHIDAASRSKPALIGQYGMHRLQVRDVHRADILSRLDPPGPEELIARQMEQREWARQREADLADDGVANETHPPSGEALVLMAELEKAGALDHMGDRSERIASNPDLVRYDHARMPNVPKPKRGIALLKLATASKRKLSVQQLAALKEFLEQRDPGSFRELMGDEGVAATFMHDTAMSASRRSPSPSGSPSPSPPLDGSLGAAKEVPRSFARAQRSIATVAAAGLDALLSGASGSGARGVSPMTPGFATKGGRRKGFAGMVKRVSNRMALEGHSPPPGPPPQQEPQPSQPEMASESSTTQATGKAAVSPPADAAAAVDENGFSEVAPSRPDSMATSKAIMRGGAAAEAEAVAAARRKHLRGARPSAEASSVDDGGSDVSGDGEGGEDGGVPPPVPAPVKTAGRGQVGLSTLSALGTALGPPAPLAPPPAPPPPALQRAESDIDHYPNPYGEAEAVPPLTQAQKASIHAHNAERVRHLERDEARHAASGIMSPERKRAELRDARPPRALAAAADLSHHESALRLGPGAPVGLTETSAPAVRPTSAVSSVWTIDLPEAERKKKKPPPPPPFFGGARPASANVFESFWSAHGPLPKGKRRSKASDGGGGSPSQPAAAATSPGGAASPSSPPSPGASQHGSGQKMPFAAGERAGGAHTPVGARLRMAASSEGGHELLAAAAGGLSSIPEARLGAFARQQEVYGEACAAQAATPVSRVLNHLDAPRLSLAHYGLGAAGTAALSELLPLNAAWRVLDLCDNGMRAEGATALATGLEQNGTLSELDLTGNAIGGSAMATLIEALSDNARKGTGPLRTLRALRVGDNALGDAATEAIVSLLGASRALGVLSLERNRLTTISASQLATQLSSRSCPLVELDLSWNSMRAAAVEELCEALAGNTNLQVRLN